jgi:N-acetylmuramoyl-L-alanine amidase
MKIIISSGHGKYIRGASGILDEVDEARKVVERTADELRRRNVTTHTYHDDVSTTQNENLQRIVDFHNAQTRDLDVSVHFNAYVETEKPMGTECLYVTQAKLAGQVSAAIADCGFIDRGGKKRTDLFFLNNTEMPALLIEVCFVDSAADADVYGTQFGEICDAIAGVLGGDVETVPPPDASLDLTGPVSWFGGPDDDGVSPSEGLAFISDIDQAPHLFLPYQPAHTTGLARRLNPNISYVACRWDYDRTPKSMLLQEMALVRNPRTGVALKAFPADWGPHEDTGRVADISPGLLDDLDLRTDDEVEVTFPYRE